MSLLTLLERKVLCRHLCLGEDGAEEARYPGLQERGSCPGDPLCQQNNLLISVKEKCTVTSLSLVNSELMSNYGTDSAFHPLPPLTLE